MLPALGEMLFLFLHFHLVTTFGKKEQSEKGRKKTEIRGKENDLQVTERDKEKAGDLLAQLWLYSPMSQNAYLSDMVSHRKREKGVS